jgi:hypothetical protein
MEIYVDIGLDRYYLEVLLKVGWCCFYYYCSYSYNFAHCWIRSGLHVIVSIINLRVSSQSMVFTSEQSLHSSHTNYFHRFISPLICCGVVALQPTINHGFNTFTEREDGYGRVCVDR